ncbi:hypothetical protein GC088_14755 [Arthrobacter sp. JZ12]|uniref:hypothetical protein n=1 Tax=Arthrobacter sp. JZ12 TaxID=2654190 RepID=UPI002B49F45C|nr:hypothetical protein [Arthrobacter sp. JZ12]WRH26203.1 hypothetical protein GC088_14755 [Arthrobacter sp. JZ12]
MAHNKDVILAADEQDLSEALGCSPDTVENLRGMGVIASQGELWEVGAARDYLRDAAWADNLWR